MATVKCNDEIEVEVVRGAWVYAGNTSNKVNQLQQHVTKRAFNKRQATI